MAWSEKTIEQHAQLLRDNSPPWFGKRQKWNDIDESARNEWRKMARFVLDAAAAVDSNPLRSLLDEAIAALEPLAVEANNCDPTCPDDEDAEVLVGDCRRARAVLAKLRSARDATR